MKNSLRILALGHKMSTNGGIRMNFKKLRYLQISSSLLPAMYFGPIFEADVSMYKTSTTVAVTRSAPNGKQQSVVHSDLKSLSPKNAVGIEKQVIEIKNNKLNLKSAHKSPLAVVIHGVQGIGKTTLANAVVAQLDLEEYNYVTFEMDEKTTKNDLTRMQEKMLRDAFPNYESGALLTSIDARERKQLLSEAFRFAIKPLFLFIDNVVRKTDIENLLPVESLPERSRMLLTTRNLRETDFCEEGGLKRIPHPMDTLPNDQAMEILCKDAAKRELMKDNDVKRILQICNGIPSVLKIVGAYLRMMEYKVDKCTQILEFFEQGNNIKDETLSERVIDSIYSRLKNFAKEAFLDICYFFNKWDRRQVEYILGAEAVGCLIDAGLVNTSVRTDRDMKYGGLVLGEELLTVDDFVRAKGRSMSKSTRDLQGLLEARRDQATTAKAIKGVCLQDRAHPAITQEELNWMKDSLRILLLGANVPTPREIEMNFKELRYLQIGSAMYHGRIFKKGVRMYIGGVLPRFHYFRHQ